MLKSEGTVEAESRMDNLGELISGMEEYTQKYGDEADLHRYLAEISLLTDVDEWEEEDEAVTLMTMHSAKGLEYPVVFITGMEEELCPIMRENDDADALEEERRLCYVGMTRAKEELYLTRARLRRRWGKVQERLPSRFLGEIPPDLLESVDQMRLVTHLKGDRSGGSSRMGADRSEGVDAMPDYENEDQDSTGFYRVGQLVDHPTLGEGRILEISGEGEKMRLVVAFTESGTRRLMACYSKLSAVQASDNE
jgi:DNA helicase-2/ATP-dependent DNA helicase PcrA